MTYAYSVTFEYETRSPDTHRGTVTASTEGPAARRALSLARKALRPVGPRSIVCVLELAPACPQK